MVGQGVEGGGEGDWGTEDVIETMEVAPILLQAMLLSGSAVEVTGILRV